MKVSTATKCYLLYLAGTVSTYASFHTVYLHFFIKSDLAENSFVYEWHNFSVDTKKHHVDAFWYLQKLKSKMVYLVNTR